MNLNDALAVIAGFSKKTTEVLTASNTAALDATIDASIDGETLSSTFSDRALGDRALPIELADYIDRICPESGLIFDAVGHPVELVKSTDLAWKPEMFSQLTGDLAKWEDDWLLIAHEGGDPIIVKASEQGESSAVYSAMQGMGFWDFAPIADSIGQFLVCACAIQHALNFPGLSQPLDDDFNLAPGAANWLFPFLRQHAGAHYDEWASVFENYLAY